MDALQLSDLLDLQVEDSHIDRLLHLRGTLPELDAYRQAAETAAEAQETLERAQREHRSLQLDLDKAEGELAIVESKLEQSEKRLYAGGMSARETEYMRQEVQSLRGQQGALEERVLGYLDRNEELTKRMDEAAAAGAATLGERDRWEQEVGSRWKEIDRQVEEHRGRRSEILPSIATDVLEMYDQLRGIKEGVAIGRLIDRVCGGCHLTLSAAEYDEVSRSDPPRCPHCRRLLVV